MVEDGNEAVCNRQRLHVGSVTHIVNEVGDATLTAGRSALVIEELTPLGYLKKKLLTLWVAHSTADVKATVPATAVPGAPEPQCG